MRTTAREQDRYPCEQQARPERSIPGNHRGPVFTSDGHDGFVASERGGNNNESPREGPGCSGQSPTAVRETIQLAENRRGNPDLGAFDVLVDFLLKSELCRKWQQQRIGVDQHQGP